jgi:2-polyprenyl-3-methyl-5-hydroxy-6-metoxy-1,4-benzoquinol methylase
MKEFNYDKSYFTGKNTFFYRLGYETTVKTFSYFKKTVKDIEHYIKKQNIKILDVGCATGDILNTFNKKYKKYGIDISDYAISEGRKKFPHIQFKIANVQKKFPFSKDTFDVITAMDIIEHIKKQETFLKNINTVLKKGGLLFIVTPNNNLLRKVIYKYMDDKEHHISLLSLEQLMILVEKNGFKIVSAWTYPTGRIPNIKFRSNIGPETFLIAKKIGDI